MLHERAWPGSVCGVPGKIAWRQLPVEGGAAFTEAHPSGWAATDAPDASKPLANDGDTVFYQLRAPLHLLVPSSTDIASVTSDWVPDVKSRGVLHARRAPVAPRARAPGGVIQGVVCAVQVTFKHEEPPAAVTATLEQASVHVHDVQKARERPSVPAAAPRLALGELDMRPPSSVPPPVSPRRGMVTQGVMATVSPGATTHRTMDAYMRLQEIAAAPGVPSIHTMSMEDLKTVASGVRWKPPVMVRGRVPVSLFVRAVCEDDTFLDVSLRVESAEGGTATLAVTSHELDYSRPAVRMPPGVLADPGADNNTLTVAFLPSCHVAISVNDVCVDVVHVPEVRKSPQVLSILRTSNTREASFVRVLSAAWAIVDPPSIALRESLRSNDARDKNAFQLTFKVGKEVASMSLDDLVRQLVHSDEVPMTRLAVQRVGVMTPVRSRDASGSRASQKRSSARELGDSDLLGAFVTGEGKLRLLFVTAGDASGWLDGVRRKRALSNIASSIVSLPGVTLNMTSAASVTRGDVGACFADESCPSWSVAC